MIEANGWQSRKMKDLISGLPSCVPIPVLRGGHIQTLAGFLWKDASHKLPFKLLEIPLADGDHLTARLYLGSSSTLIYGFHGLTGSVESLYMQRLAKTALQLSHSALLVNHRGCGEGIGAKGIYHSGRSDDLATAIEFGRSFPEFTHHIAIGFSLSANALLLLLGRDQHLSQPDAAVAINGPIDLATTSQALSKAHNKIYDYHFRSELWKDYQQRKKNELLEKKINMKFPRSLAEFDDLFTAPLGGFRNKEDYYHLSSAFPHIHKIQQPTAIISTYDDPFIPIQPYLDLPKDHPNVHVRLEKNGGHLGYISRNKNSHGTYRWLDHALGEIIPALNTP